MTKEIHGWEDVIDSRDVVARAADLQEYKDDHDRESMMPWSAIDPAGAQELKDLDGLLAQLHTVGGDSPEDGQTLVRESYFETYAQELWEDTADSDTLKAAQNWPLNCIDWEQAARELAYDYTSVTFRDVTYYVR